MASGIHPAVRPVGSRPPPTPAYSRGSVRTGCPIPVPIFIKTALSWSDRIPCPLPAAPPPGGRLASSPLSGGTSARWQEDSCRRATAAPVCLTGAARAWEVGVSSAGSQDGTRMVDPAPSVRPGHAAGDPTVTRSHRPGLGQPGSPEHEQPSQHWVMHGHGGEKFTRLGTNLALGHQVLQDPVLLVPGQAPPPASPREGSVEFQSCLCLLSACHLTSSGLCAHL